MDEKYFLIFEGKMFTFDTIDKLETALNSRVPADAATQGAYHIFKGTELRADVVREALPPKVEYANKFKIYRGA